MIPHLLKNSIPLAWLLCCCCCSGLFAQTPQQVTAGCGATGTAVSGYTIDFTVGEAVTATTAGSIIFTQGFLQPPLPGKAGYAVPYITLRAEGKENDVLLDWTSNAEVNNRLFYVQRGADSVSFTTIDSVFTKAPGGNSNTPLQYRYTDLQPLPGKSYYRLLQAGLQGNNSYSNIVMAQVQHSRWSIHLYPNPIQNTLQLKLFTDISTVCMIRLVNEEGQQIITPRYASFIQGYNDYSLNLSFLAPGMYVLHVMNMALGEQMRIKVIKQ